MTTTDSDATAAVQPKLLIANRGEIATRIQRTAKKLGIPTVAIYTLADAETPHVRQAEEAFQIGDGTDPRGYLDIDAIVGIAKESGATMVAPGYGFLSENSAFVKAIEAAGIIFLGPTPLQMTSMGLKHEARAVAVQAGVPVVPGSDGAVDDLEVAVQVAHTIGYPVIVKASGGGGGMGMEVCRDEQELRDKFEATRTKGANLFKEPTVFLEKYISKARHIEVQIFGNGAGHVVHFGERECSVQRRHQKVIEEAPCALFASEIGKAAVALGELMQYRSAGTVEFILDDTTLEFYFLELNARIQVEHPVTEVIRPGLDLVELMIKQGLRPDGSLPKEELDQVKCAAFKGHAIEVRVYCENPKQGFRPCPGRLQAVQWGDIGERGRIETWVSTGTLVTPNYDPMIAKLIVYGETRDIAIERMLHMLRGTTISGPPNNLDYLETVLDSSAFRENKVYTTSLDTFEYTPSAIEIITPGVATSVQDMPGRRIGKGISRCGAADQPSMRLANWLVGNEWSTEGLEMTMLGAKILFHSAAAVAVTGAEMPVTINKAPVDMWTTLHVKAGDVLNIGAANAAGMRSYLAIKGGFPGILPYMGSKSTFGGAGLGGYQGRNLLAGDMLNISRSSASDINRTVPVHMRPRLGNEWQLEVTPSAQWSDVYISPEGMATITGEEFTATTASNRSGIRLEGPRIKWARPDGGEGGSHPSNVLDQGYAFGALNLNGDTPVLFGVDGPDLGGFANLAASSTASMWKFGQIRPGDKIRFVVIDVETSRQLKASMDAWLEAIQQGSSSPFVPSSRSELSSKPPADSLIAQQRDVIVRAASDEYINIEMGPLTLDITTRVRLQLWEQEMLKRNVAGVHYMDTSIRTSIIHYDPDVVTQDQLITIALECAGALRQGGVESVTLPITVYRLPIVIDDPWTRADIEYYQKTARKDAVYLPNNFKYVARNNGLSDDQMRDVILGTPWTVVSIGFFVMLPFLIPADPRKRVLAQKYNPSRTRTCEGALGLAGVIGAIYPIAAPGGYQLLGRTLSTWRPWNKVNSLVGNFDQIEFYEVAADDFEQINRLYKSGMWEPEKRQIEFSMAKHLAFEDSIKDETRALKESKRESVLKSPKKQSFQQYLAYKAAEEKSAADKLAKGQAPVGVGRAVVAPLSASVWKYYVKPGDLIKDDDQRIVELEAMKTSVWITPGEDTVGKKVLSMAVKEGEAVNPGQTLLYIEE